MNEQLFHRDIDDMLGTQLSKFWSGQLRQVIGQVFHDAVDKMQEGAQVSQLFRMKGVVNKPLI